MSLFEKSLQSFLTNTNGAMYSGSPAPILCIADTTPYPSTLVQQTLIHKLAPNEPLKTVSTQKAQTSTPLIIALSRSTHPLFSTLDNPSVSILFPPTATSGTNPGYLTTTQWTPQTIMSSIYSTIQSSQPSPPQPQRPIVVLIDSLSTTLKNYQPAQIPSLITAILSIPTVSGIILSISTDTLLSTTPSLDHTDPLAQHTISGVDVLDNITSIATTLFQILPPPSKFPSALLSCRVSHRSSNGKITAETVPLQPHATKPGLVTCSAVLGSGKGTNGDSRTSDQDSNANTALPEGLQNLPFNLALTQHQMQQRAQVELPYAHQGQQQQGGVGTGVLKNTSSTAKMGLLSSVPVRKNANFDEIIDDEESDEDGEL